MQSYESVDDKQVWGRCRGSQVGCEFFFLFPSYLSSLCYIEDNASFKYGGSELDSFI